MNVYFAGTPGIEKRERKWQTLLRSRLLSYWDIQENQFSVPFAFNLIMENKNKVHLFLDSGAFSAWTQNAKIKMEDYIKFIIDNKDYIGIYANLDVIKIKRNGIWAGPNRRSAEKTLKNQKIMEAAGLNPLPCFHFGEPEEYLAYYVDNYDYIALGVAGNSGISSLMEWMDMCFSKYICDEKGMPKVKVHGFAVTALTVMLRYPFFSVDSSSWVVTSRVGSIYVPYINKGKCVYDVNPWKIAVSAKSPTSKEAGKHLTTLSPLQKEIILQYIADKGYKLGKSEFKKIDQDHLLAENEKWAEKKPVLKSVKRQIELLHEVGLCNNYQMRDEMNIIYFKDLESECQPWPWPFLINEKRPDKLF